MPSRRLLKCRFVNAEHKMNIDVTRRTTPMQAAPLNLAGQRALCVGVVNRLLEVLKRAFDVSNAVNRALQ